MSKKKKNGQASQPERTGGPKLLAIACIVSGAVGSWYWTDVQQQAKSSKGESTTLRWDHPNSATVLIEPNTNDRMQSSEELAASSPNYGQLPADLVGSHQVELRPYSPPVVGTLEERVAREPLPVLPISRGGTVGAESTKFGGESRLALGRPPVWTDEGSSGGATVPGEEKLRAPGTTIRGLATSTAPGKSDAWDTTNPFEQLALAPSAGNSNHPSKGPGEALAVRGIPSGTTWPDQNFRPDTNPSGLGAPALALQSKPIPERSSNPTLGVFAATNLAQPTKIHPSDEPPTGNAKPHSGAKLTSTERIESQPAGWNPNTTEPKKSRAVIRQPKSGI